jgi:putative ABC transport system permease protein
MAGSQRPAEDFVADVRWRKLIGDVRASRGRFVAMLAAIAVALAGVGVVLGGRAVLGREIRSSYLGTRPADATLELEGGVDATLLAELRARADIEEADARQMIKARLKKRPEDPWQMLVLFVAEDFRALRLNTFRPERGAWPPPPGAILVERTSLPVIGVELDEEVIVKTPRGTEQPVTIAGTVHDAGQAPSWQEHRGCAYATLDTLAKLGEPPLLHELLVRFRPDPRSVQDVERQTIELAAWLRARGHTVHELRVPKLRQHPHQGLMNISQLVLLGFSLMLLMLAAIVVATVLSAMLARQVREIGVMKAVGANARQLAGMYGVFVLGLGAISVAAALPLAHLGATAMIDNIATMMNLAITNPTIPPWVYAVVAVLGMFVPLIFASIPILRATRISVRRALAQDGAGADFVRPSRLPIAVRNALRRPGRLMFTMVLLIAGGALVNMAANLQSGLMQISSKLEVARRYDVEVRLIDPLTSFEALKKLPGITALEAWSAADVALAGPDQTPDIVRTFPDGGHGSVLLVAPPAGGSKLTGHVIISGRWLEPDDTDSVVLGHNALRGVRAGERVTISLGGRRSTWMVAGVVEEIGGSSAFVTEAAFRRATGIEGVNLLRIATSARSDVERAPIIAALEQKISEQGAAVYYAMPSPLLRSIIDDHVFLVVRAVFVVASLLAIVGLFALGSATAINFAERTRELAIMKAIGASDRRVFALILGEALFVGLASSVLSALLAVPLTLWVDARIASRGFIAPPPFAISYVVLFGWPLLVGLGSMLAAMLPARRAMRLTVRQGLGEI